MRSNIRLKRPNGEQTLGSRNGASIGARVWVAWAIVILIGWTAPSVPAAESEDIANAELAAASWLALIDVGTYDEGWHRTTGDIRNRDELTWIQWMQQRRGPIGNLLSRTIVYAGPLRFARGEPQGKYLEIEYDTDFEAIADLFEYVRMERVKNGSWAVCWYFVRRQSSSELSHTANAHEQNH